MHFYHPWANNSALQLGDSLYVYVQFHELANGNGHIVEPKLIQFLVIEKLCSWLQWLLPVFVNKGVMLHLSEGPCV